MICSRRALDRSGAAGSSQERWMLQQQHQNSNSLQSSQISQKKNASGISNLKSSHGVNKRNLQAISTASKKAPDATTVYSSKAANSSQ